MKIQDIYSLYSKYYLVDTDTRKIRKNSIYFALRGGNFNGNKFAQESINKGATYAVIDEEKYANKNTILVDNVLQTLQQLANYHRNQLAIPIISLTGSNGKTTTKELINAVLSKRYITTATLGNLNNHIGVPLTLLSMTPKTEIGIVEMGANHHKEIAFLCSLTEPDYGYITNFGKAHLEGFGSLEGVIEAKSELYDYSIKNNKTVFINPTDKIQVKKSKGANTILFDTKNLKFNEVNPFVKLNYNSLSIQSNLIGKYNYNNIAAAITIGNYFKIDHQLIKEAIEEYIPTNNRSQIINKDSNKIILDAYNANPTSIKAALENFYLLTDKNKVVILGDMFELGKRSKHEHQSISDLCGKLNFKNVFLVGENFHQTKTKNKTFITFDDLKNYIKNDDISESTILIKGSRGMALERLLDFF